MPGIVGVIAKVRDQDQSAQLRLMLKALTNESSDWLDTYENPEMGIWLGWSWREAGPGEGLAVWNEKRDNFLVFSGEEFDPKTWINALKARGHQIVGESASCLIHAFEDEGINFLAGVDGRYSGVIWNEREGKIYLFVDRFGLKRVYCHEDEQALYFSSEAKSLLRILHKTRQFNPTSLGEFFALGFVMDDRTLFAGIELIPAGSVWMFSSDGHSEKGTYFKTAISENHEPSNEPDPDERLMGTLASVMARTALIRDKLAVALDGGIETRVLMAWAPFPPLKVPCFTPFVGKRDQAIVQVARQVAGICQQHHKSLGIPRGFISEFPALAKRTVIYSDGATDVSGSVDLFINRLARDFAHTCIRGDFGKQVLGNGVFELPRTIDESILDKSFLPKLEAGNDSYCQMLQDADTSLGFFKLLPWCYYPRLELTHVHMGLRLPYLDNDLVQLNHFAPLAGGRGNKRMLRLVAAGDVRLAKIRVLEESADEGRRFSSQPSRFSLNRTAPQSRGRGCGRSYAYLKIRQRLSEHGVEVAYMQRLRFNQFRIWYRGELSRYVKDILLDQRTRQRSYLNGARVEEILNAHIKGNGDFTTEIHRLLTVELVQRHLMDLR